MWSYIHYCDVNADCFNTIGDFHCTCQVGWSITNDYGRTFSNDDECANGVHACSSHATCTDTSESHECECNVGFSGSGFECENIGKCSDDTKECDGNASCTELLVLTTACGSVTTKKAKMFSLATLVLMTMNAKTEVLLLINIPKSVLTRIITVFTPALVIRPRNTT